MSFLKLVWSKPRRPTIEIPPDLRALCERRQGDIYYDRIDSKYARQAMDELGIEPETEFYAFFSTFCISNMYSDHDNETLAAIFDYRGEPNIGIHWAHENWGVPERYIAITSLEGEGGYFYDSESGAVIDYENGGLDALLRGNVKMLNSTLFGFMRWFLQ